MYYDRSTTERQEGKKGEKERLQARGKAEGETV